MVWQTHRFLASCAAFLALLFILVVGPSVAGGEPPWQARVVRDWGIAAQPDAVGGMRVIVLTAAEDNLARLQGRGCGITHRLRDSTGLVCPAAVGRELLETRAAAPDTLRKLHDLAADQYIFADAVWDSRTGTGVKVAVLDTGIQADHEELASSVLAVKSFIKGPAADNNGHGTHVAGIVTGDGIYQLTNDYGYPSPNTAKGVAPDAGLLSGRVCGRDGYCYDSDVVAGLEWAVAQGARVINLSLGGENYDGHCDEDLLAQKVNWAVDQGAVVTVSAGNDNAGVSSPACASKAIAVGAVYHAAIGTQDYSPTCADASTAPDQRVCFSNYGAALDIMAPGAAVLSSYPCRLAGSCKYTWYAWSWGTSMAAPHVAGAAALVLQANPALTPAEVKAILESTARKAGKRGDETYFGAGILDVEAAVDMATAGVKGPRPGR